ncbi:MaoC family dehydratase [Magnetospirillum gryphiswaldense]|uniref:Dehydratase n=2 Tax=Magnetospirillum gryphiswaldense TaxID=55518 RepID=V6EZJ5_MAGGM|nr:MaoC family dehydratase [Magnetospirillum gryphiswaldense]AVM73331.1 Bifunctional protein PaaZ [Magnetospirillum gryphiswaldense MSR-1]AVM77234.1 Bifunctional protein PaaZ [Magnetospirillum gryphiswaldense]CAM74360.1 Acyl dehydratase [Magnetospirillum gryphiswaldense MSR-1]CDK98629.1 putative dehydratase [Magnetospirillum gryphiswaldense MSR-1 v2]
MSKLYLDDISAGDTFKSGDFEVTAQSIKEFAALWDPQVFHLDEVAAEDSFFNGLAASGWQTACITMRLLVTSGFTPVNGVIGAGIEELKWFRPVRPGDVLRAEMEVLEVRPMRSKPGYGICRMRVTTVDAAGEKVQVFTSPLVVQSKG